MPESNTPLYVRLATDAAQRIDAAVVASGLTKRQIVEDAVREHLGAGGEGLVVGRIALREPAPEILTAGEAAALLRIGEPELVQAAERGELPGRRIAGEWRFAREALLAWLAVSE
jgi:excisionase family DNA binding protein